MKVSLLQVEADGARIEAENTDYSKVDATLFYGVVLYESAIQ